MNTCDKKCDMTYKESFKSINTSNDDFDQCDLRPIQSDLRPVQNFQEWIQTDFRLKVMAIKGQEKQHFHQLSLDF